MSGVFRSSALRHWLVGMPAGWSVMGASVLVNAISDGTWFYGFAVFFLPISRDLGLGRAATSLPFAIKGIIMAALSPPLGIWIDRVGPSQVLRVSAVIAGIGYFLLGVTHGYGAFVASVALITIGMLGFVPSTSAAVTRWARRRRSLAMSVAHMGFTVGAAVIPPLLALGVATGGWRVTVLAVGIGLWTIVVPLSRYLKHPPFVVDPPDAIVSDSTAGDVEAARRRPGRSDPPEVDLSTALRSPAFWFMSLALGLQSMVGSATSLHMVAIMTWKGIPESTAGYLIGFSALAMTPMVLGAGWLGDRIAKGKLAALASLSRALAWFIVGLWPSFTVPEMMLALLLLAPGESIWALSFALQADLFGTRHYATLRGISGTVTSIMGGITPWLAGWIYDTTGSYGWLLIPSGVATAVAGTIMWRLPSRRVA